MSPKRRLGSNQLPAPARFASRPVIRAVPAVARAIAILRLLARSSDALGVNAIARELALVPSTALHILRALVSEGLVTSDPVTKRYRLDSGVLTLARSALRQDAFAQLVQPEIDALADRFTATAVGVRMVGLKHMIVVGISRPDTAIRLHVDVGSRFPALISATGRCLAAFGNYPDRDIEKAFRALRWDSAPSYKEWRAEVEETRQTGFGVDRGNYIRGVTIVAAPVFGRDRAMTHALVAIALTDQLSATAVEVMGKELVRSAGRVSERLGGLAQR